MTNDTSMEQLVLPAYEANEDAPETFAVPPCVHVASPSDPTTEQAMRLVEFSGSLDFWDRPEEDIYTLDDGRPI